MTNNKVVSKEIRLKERPSGLITEENFEIVEVKVREPNEGEFLVHNVWMSVDPHMRIYLTKGTKLKPALRLNEPLNGGCIGQIIESKNNKYKVGEYVLGNSAWREYWISNGNSNSNNRYDDVVVKIDPKIAPIQHFLGILGIAGLTAYVGLLKIGELRQNMDTVFVSAAAGAVGSIACQIAQIKGCTVIGSAGNDDKVEWLINNLKIDFAFNYKKLEKDDQINYRSNGISSQLEKLCPNGIDLYFDNVGGSHLEAAIYNMNTFGRIVLCGATSQYNFINDDNNRKHHPYLLSAPVGPSNLNLAISYRLKLQGFLFSDHYNILNEFQSKMSKWIKDDRIKWKETIYEGLENAPKAFIGLFKGWNIGKTLVKI